MITRTFKLCLNAGSGSAPYINVSQYDEGETWLFELYSETGERYIPSSGAIVGVKSDGHGIVNTGTVDSEGRVVITETQQMTASAGRAIYELSIDGLTHGTANFIVAVERKPTDDAVMSDSDLSLIQQALDSAEVIVEVIGDGDPSEVIGEHVDAWLDAHPEATTTVEDGAITAPKINQSLWDKLLVSEESSGAVASFDDGADDVPVSSLKVALEPIQTGTGDPSPSNVRPIIASNGKNILPLTAASCQSNSTVGTWSGNAYTHLGVTYTLNTGTDGTVESVTMNGTSTGASELRIALVSFDPTKTYKVNGIVGGSTTTYCFNIGGVGTYYDNDYTVTFEDTSEHICRLQVPSGVTVSNATVQPMIRLDGTDATYQPYQGITVERTGKNLFDPYSTGNIWVNVSGVPSPATNAKSVQLKADAGETYTLSNKNAASASNVILLAFFDASDTLLLRKVASAGNKYVTATAPNGTSYFYASFYTWTDADEAQLERGELTNYEPFTFTSYPYSLGRAVYGGTVDLATGVLTVDRAMVDLGSLNYTYRAPTETRPIPRFSSPIVSGKDGLPLTEICSVYKIDGSPVYSGGVDYSLCVYNSSVYILDSRFTSASDFKTAMNGVQLCYELAEPQTYRLTPTQVKTLLGYNNISSIGTVDVIYHADTKLYVDKMTNVDNNIIAPTEADFTATRNYTVNDLLIVADTLYKVTANIATGSAITPNSNVTQTTLSALIKALS